MVLDRIGDEAIPVLAPMLSSQNATNRAFATWIIGNRGTNVAPFTRRFQAQLSDPSPVARAAAAEALLKLNSDPRPVIAALLQSFHEGDQTTRSYVLRTFGSATNWAQIAVPVLLDLLNAATNTYDRVDIHNAIWKLDRSTAEKVFTNLLPRVPAKAKQVSED